MIAPPQTGLRLNCAVQPDGSIIQPYSFISNNGLRSDSPLGFYYARDRDSTAPRMAEGPANINGRSMYIDGKPQDQIIGSPYVTDYADSIIGSTFVGDDGQTYVIANPNARSSEYDAQQQKWNEDLLQALGISDSTILENEDKEKELTQQVKELKDAKTQLEKLQKEMRELQQRAAEDDMKNTKKIPIRSSDTTKESSQPSRDSQADLQELKKTEGSQKPTKRQTQYVSRMSM
uniref:Uncharacterized protein n=2 Tax=Graphocephala atropunctata TaxID=36148 RepID=A0A1B6LKC8_9HEMI